MRTATHLVVAALVATFALALPAPRAAADVVPPDKAEEKATPETFDSPTGGKVTLDLKHLERRTLLVFAANFCPICRRETPNFLKLAHDKKGELDVVGVVMDSERDAAKAYVDKQKLDYPTIWDPEWRFAMRFKVKSTPTLVLLAKDGTVELVAPGLTPELEKKL
ncbi:MAG: TlpA family protein disulfide reductase [Myxococcales bacterium]|nr:TlpA family protein disulfide reductase [Myxococcales bacterium]MCB9737463.1 TlpA family protein disulfide reductase [Deltaproteobacteria bacterium]